MQTRIAQGVGDDDRQIDSIGDQCGNTARRSKGVAVVYLVPIKMPGVEQREKENGKKGGSSEAFEIAASNKRDCDQNREWQSESIAGWFCQDGETGR